MPTSLPTLPPERCETCRFFGGVIDEMRQPSGQCRRKAPGEYAVGHVLPFSDGRVIRLNNTTSPFPGVWPADWCGEYQRRFDPPAPKEPARA